MADYHECLTLIGQTTSETTRWVKQKGRIVVFKKRKLHKSNANKGVDCLISRKTCLKRLTNFKVPSKIEIQLQFIILLTKVRGKVFCSGRFSTHISKCFQHKLLT